MEVGWRDLLNRNNIFKKLLQKSMHVDFSGIGARIVGLEDHQATTKSQKTKNTIFKIDICEL